LETARRRKSRKYYCSTTQKLNPRICATKNVITEGGKGERKFVSFTEGAKVRGKNNLS